MDVTPLIPEGRQIVQAYTPGGFKISGVIFDGGVIVTPMKTRLWTAPASFMDLRVDDFYSLAEEQIDVLLLGTGGRGEFVPPSLRADLKSHGLSVDAMDTGAACRTYNVLMAEGRRVAAALMPL
jgi:uncharacterized protein